MEHLTAVEFNVIVQALAGHALSEAAKDRCRSLLPAKTAEDAARRMRDTSQARQILDACGSPPVSMMTELQRVLALVELEGLLTPEEIARLSVFLASCRRMKRYLAQAESTGCEIALYGGSIHDLSTLEDEIDRCIRNGQVDDKSSDRLYTLRRRMHAADDEIKEKLSALLRKNRDWFSESFVAVRNGRQTLPVKREHRARVPGALVDMSSSGSTCFIEPESVGKLHTALFELRVEEDAEVRRILYALGADILTCLPQIKANIQNMETLDFLFAKAKLSRAMNASPAAISEDAEMRILSARHPLLDERTAVPLDFAIGGGVSGIVVTGPNTGGKTVALKTVGLLSLMAQSGLHVPADSRSSFCMRDQVLADIGDKQSISDNLSTFSSHLQNILSIFQSLTPDSLVLLDEIGAGTDPAEGMGIAIAILDALRASGCLFLATTHYPEIKEYAETTEGLINARMAFDRESLLPLYRLEIGAAGESCALHIAKQLGMPEDMLRRAERAAYGGRVSALAASERPPALLEVRPNAYAEPPPEEKPVPRSQRFSVGDSVTVYPGRQIGIVYAKANARGEIGVQIRDVKRLVPHKRLKLLTAAESLYPDEYDMAVVLDSVANRKARRVMQRRHEAGNVIVHREGNKE
ncbi:MAG: DNA mismatch repair protein MutS [Clostridia bacterium]|nr:DNA mismatch repair protein MutS [Clostridia bacterium]